MNGIREAFRIPEKYRRRLATALVRPFVAHTEGLISYANEGPDSGNYTERLAELGYLE